LQKFEFGCQINATKKEIGKWLNVSETTLDVENSAHYHRIMGIILHPASRKARGLWQNNRCARVLFVFAGLFVP
jgi:hypothetical protein